MYISNTRLDSCEVLYYTETRVQKALMPLANFEPASVATEYPYQWESREDCIMRSFITSTFRRILLERSSEGGCDGRGM
jgi:hypothetical protein